VDFNEAQEALDGLRDTREYDEDLETVDTSEGHPLPQGLQFFQTSTTAYKTGRNPRTVRASYDYSTNTMYVVFWDGTYWYYENVSPDLWSEFKSVESKGKFLHEKGFNAGNFPMGAVDMNAISNQRRAALTANLEVARKLQEAYKGRRTSKTLYGRGHDYRLRGQGGFER